MFLNLLSKVGQPKTVDETSEKVRVVVEAERSIMDHGIKSQDPCIRKIVSRSSWSPKNCGIENTNLQVFFSYSQDIIDGISYIKVIKYLL